MWNPASGVPSDRGGGEGGYREEFWGRGLEGLDFSFSSTFLLVTRYLGLNKVKKLHVEAGTYV